MVEQPAVLLVEDEPILRRMAAIIIDHAGWNVVEASSAAEALKLLADHPAVGVLFTDTELPGTMGGIELSKRVHDIRPDIELIVTSARASVPKRLLPDDGTFLAKPYGVSDLVKVLREKLC